MPKTQAPNDDLLAALVAKPLTEFEDRNVIRAAIEIPGAGDPADPSQRNTRSRVDQHTEEAQWLRSPFPSRPRSARTS